MQEEDTALGDALLEAEDEEAAVARLAPLAAAHHKHAFQDLRGGDGDPLPLEALGDELVDQAALQPPALFQRPWEFWEQHRDAAAPKAPFGALQRLAALERDRVAAGPRAGDRAAGGRQSAQALVRRRHFYEFADDQPIRVRVLDVDALPLEELHRAFAFTIVRRLPAEKCVRIASRLAVFRDSTNQNTYECLIRDCGRLFGPTHGPELLALFSRCYATISVPFLLDYTRRYGTFSKQFIAEQVEQSLTPQFFDFVRYRQKGGLRPLPPIVARPWALSSYTRLMQKSYLKSRLHQLLQEHGHIPASKLEDDVADDLPAEVRVSEQLSAAGALRVAAPTTARELRRQQETRWRTEENAVRRPALLDAVMAAEHSGQGWNPADAEAVKAIGKTDRSRYRQFAASAIPAGDTALARVDPDAPDTDDEVEELIADADPDVGPRPRGGGPRPRRDAIRMEDLEDAAEAQPPQGFGLQFEHVVPDSVLGSDTTAVALPDAGRAEAGRQDELDFSEVPDRFWSRWRRPFFRHMHKSYRLLEGGWRQVPDPAGPRPFPRRRFRPRPERKEQRQRYQMRSQRPET